MGEGWKKRAKKEGVEVGMTAKGGSGGK